MPIGQATIRWTEGNDAKLLMTILTVQEVKVDYPKVAAAFGMGVDAQAIRNRLSKLRMRAKEQGLAPSDNAVASKSSGKQTKALNKTKAKGKKQAGGMLSKNSHDKGSADAQAPTADSTVTNNDQSAGEDSDANPTDPAETHPETPKTSVNLQKTIGGRVTKPRVSPRKDTKKDYKELGDPFKTLTENADEDGEKIFNTDRAESEDTFQSDQEYMKDAQAATIKMEQEI